ncbi:MAG: hypothetical protein ACLFQX_06000 [Candidatus Kapaibacterium sp.]
MHKLLIIMTMMLIGGAASRAEIDFKFDGYIYDLPMAVEVPDALAYFGQSYDKDYLWMNLTRLRLRPTLELSHESRLTMHYEMDMMYSDLSLPYFMGTGMTNRQAVDLHDNFLTEGNWNGQHYIDMLYYKHMFDWGEVTFGRQVISWGVGRIWQPMDMFNPINPANFSKFEKDGADALSAKYYFGMFTDLEVVYNFRERWEDGNFAARFRTNTGEYDLTAMAGYFDQRPNIGGAFAGNIATAGVRGEAVYTIDPDDPDSSYARAILGIDHQLTPDLYAMLEYHYNGQGTTCKKCYNIARVFSGEMLNVGKHYLFAQGRYALHPLWNVSMGNMLNMTDGSGFVTGMLSYSASENCNLNLAGMGVYGDKLDEYWYYSSAAYLQAEFYF